MLGHPYHDVVTICGIDPGTTLVGLGVEYVKLPQWEVVKVQAWTLNATRMPLDPVVVNTHGERVARLMVIRDWYASRFSYLRPMAIGSESAFYNSGTPGAYEPLVESITYIRQAVMDYDRHMPIHFFKPTAVKKIMGHGQHGKLDVAKALIDLYGTISVTPIQEWQAHATDGLAVADCVRRIYRDQLPCGPS